MLRVENLQGGYKEREILKGVSFAIESGSVVSILGANGSGKSTLLKMIIGSLPYQGAVYFRGREGRNLGARERAECVAYVPQSHAIPFEFSAFEVALMGRFRESPWSFGYAKEDKRLALEAMERIGALHLKDRIYRELSGGERQLVLLSRALAQRSEMIIMDEPVTGLDFGNQRRLLELMSSLASEGKTIVQTTHYPEHALEVSDRVVWLHEGRIIADASPQEAITPERLWEVYRVRSERVELGGGEWGVLALPRLHRHLNKEKP